MSDSKTRRRGRGEDGIYFDRANKVWVGAVSLGYGGEGNRVRRKVSGPTKTAVKDRLKDLHKEIEAGVRTPATYTVDQLMQDWLETLADKSAKTQKNAKGDSAHIVDSLGAVKVRDLTARNVQAALQNLAATRSTRVVQLARAALIRALDHAQFNDLVMRNVASLTSVPTGQEGRPSKALNLQQAQSLLAAAEGTRLEAYVVVSLLAGVRTEEARALTWADVDLDAATIYVVRSVRVGGDVKTKKSRRGLELPKRAVDVLKAHKLQQDADRVQAGAAWKETGIVFASTIGTPLDPANVRREFKKITKTAGLGPNWTPLELRHSFVSLLSDHGVSLEDIADLVGHSGTRTTEGVYRHQLKPVLRAGAGVMDSIFPRDAQDHKEPELEPTPTGTEGHPETQPTRSGR